MKTIQLTILMVIIIIGRINSQTLYIPDNLGTSINAGKVGIGTNSPTTQLDIVCPYISGQESISLFKVSDAANDFLKIMNGTGLSGQFIPSILGQHFSDNRLAFSLTGVIGFSNDVGTEPIMAFDSRISNSAVTTRPLFAWSSYGNTKMTLLANGSLGIGTTTTGSHKLAVEGSIGAREIKVEASGWSDFVFDNNYKLRSLEETEQFILKNQHLPEIPNTNEVLENGINLGEMNAKLLQKIEELTLYMIEQNKEIKTIKTQLIKLSEEKEKLKSKIVKMEASE